MAKKSQAHFSYSTKTDLIKFSIDIGVSTDFKFFYSTFDLPDNLKNLPSTPHGIRQYFESFGALRDEILKLIEDYEVSLIEQVKTKVILYEIDIEDNHGDLINFKHKVLQKITLSRGDKEPEIHYYEERSSRDHYGANINISLDHFNEHQIFNKNFKEMAWSKEREEFFKSISEAIRRVQDMIKTGLGHRPETLAKKIDQGAKLSMLIGNGDGNGHT